MKEPCVDPPRWRDHHDQCALAERALGQDLRAIKTPAPLSGAQMARIAAGLRPVRPGRSLRWLVAAASLLLFMATAASAAHLKLLPRWLTGASAPTPVPTPESRIGHRKPSGPGGHAPKPAAAPSPREDSPAPAIGETQAVGTSETQAPAVTPQPPASPHDPVRARPVVRQASGLAPAPQSAPGKLRSLDVRRNVGVPENLGKALSPSPSGHGEVKELTLTPTPLPDEPPAPVLPPARVPPPAPRMAMLDTPRPAPSPPASQPAKPRDEAEVSQSLAEAIRLVRADGQPQSALALLDRQATRLNQSPYRHEALLIRVEAMLALKRDADLLRLLDGTPLADVAASRTLLVTRGRLRAAAHRCAEAVVDFDRALAEPGRKDKQALLGRALCRETLGDAEGAKADRERYRQETSPAPTTP